MLWLIYIFLPPEEAAATQKEINDIDKELKELDGKKTELQRTYENILADKKVKSGNCEEEQTHNSTLSGLVTSFIPFLLVLQDQSHRVNTTRSFTTSSFLRPIHVSQQTVQTHLCQLKTSVMKKMQEKISCRILKCGFCFHLRWQRSTICFEFHSCKRPI